MADQLQLRGGTTAEHASFTGALREVTVDTTKKTLVVHDAATVGGIPLAKESALSSYLTTSAAASTYQTQAGMSSYLTTSAAGSTYAPLASPTFTGSVTIPAGASIAGYLTSATAASTYAPLASPTFTGTVTIPAGASITGYLTTASASSTYLTQANAASTYQTQAGMSSYLTTSSASSTYAPQASPTLTGQPYVNGSYRGNVVAVAALDIDCSAGNYFTKTVAGDSTFSVSNIPSSRAYAFTLEVTHTSGTITWFSNVQWPKATPPTLTTGKTHLFMFVTDDAGARWRAASLVDYTN